MVGRLALLVVFTLGLFEFTGHAKERPVDKVYPLLDTENSRWFFFSSACRPFGMVNLSPDTEVNSDWGAGYRYRTENIKGFSHIHAWQLSGISVMPICVDTDSLSDLFQDCSSDFSHNKEIVEPGYHGVELSRYGIKAELTSTCRVGFHQYTYPSSGSKGVLFSLNEILGPCKNEQGMMRQVDEYTFCGHVINGSTTRRPKPIKIFFYVSFDQPVDGLERDEKTGNYLLKINSTCCKLLMKVAISYTSCENARCNMETELPGWNFKEVVKDSQNEWNSLLSRIEVKGGTDTAQRRFYTDLWHALQGRRIISDCLGTYPDYTGATFRIGQIPLSAENKPLFNHYNSDAFWGAQFSLNALWGLVYPDIYQDFVYSLMQYYRDGGMVPRGPAGGNYTFVMTGASSTPFIVSAIQKGIVKDDLPFIYEALKKNHMPGGIMERGGYEHNTTLGGGLKYYISKGYVPYPNPDKSRAFHQDGAGMTLEYAYQDYALAQLALRLGIQNDYDYFMSRSHNYRNLFDEKSGWIRPKDVLGRWREDFDPYEYKHGFVESNSAQMTWFVPQDIEGLAHLMGGVDRAAERLDKQFKEASKLNFTSGTSHSVELHPEYQRIPINYGNQPSIQTAFVFHKLGRPDLSQYWSSEVVKKAFSGLSPSTGYNGDEDQGIMGALAVLMKIGLFQLDGGVSDLCEYQIGSPIFKNIRILLHPDYYLGDEISIKISRKTPEEVSVKKMRWNGKEVLNGFLPHEELVSGGELLLEMQ